jgi:hypothetical protein
VQRHSELTNELATQRRANSSFAVLWVTLLLCGRPEATGKSPVRRCNKCGADMTPLSNLPPFRGAAAIRVFRCYVCNNVVSEENH